jgi:hypothetical protein
MKVDVTTVHGAKAGSVGEWITVQLKTTPRPLAVNHSNTSAPHQGQAGRGAKRTRSQPVQRWRRSS